MTIATGDERWCEARLDVSVAGSLVRAAAALRLTPQSTDDSRNVKHAAVRGARPRDEDAIEPDFKLS